MIPRSLALLLTSVGAVSLLYGWKFFQNRNLEQVLAQVQEQAERPSSPQSRPDTTHSVALGKASLEEQRKSRLFSAFVKYRQGGDNPILPNNEFSDLLDPHENLAALFGLSAEQMNELKKQGLETMKQICAWEIEKTIDVTSNDSETQLICRLPLGDETMLQLQQEYLQGIETILGEDNFAFIKHSVERPFKPLTTRERVISVTIAPDDRGEERYRLSVEQFDKKGNIRSRTQKGGMLNHSLNRVPERYRHLLTIDFEGE